MSCLGLKIEIQVHLFKYKWIYYEIMYVAVQQEYSIIVTFFVTFEFSE